MEISEIVVDKTTAVDLPWEETYIYPVADLQLGSDGCHEKMFRRHIQEGKERNAWFLFVGDVVDVASPSNRAKLKAAGLYDSLKMELDRAAERMVEKFLGLVEGTEGRWLGFIEGHHTWEFQTLYPGETTDTIIARKLKAPFLGACAFVRLRFRVGKKTKTTLTLWAHHGSGGGIKAAAPLNKIENIVPAFDADIYVMAHQHKLAAAPIDQLYMTSRRPYKLSHRQKWMVSAGSFMRGYQLGSHDGTKPAPSYVEARMLKPTALGAPVIRCVPYRDGNDYRVGIEVSMRTW